MDVYTKDDKEMVVEIHAPGFSKDDIKINIHEGVLEIQGQKEDKQTEQDKGRTYMVHESAASFYRRIGLPRVADTNNIAADFTEGLLKITVPFKEQPKPKQIDIKTDQNNRKSK
jgi:HSP20 family protein